MWQYFPALNDVGYPGRKMLWFPLNGFYKQLQTCLSSPLLDLLMPHSGLLLSHCLLLQVSVALKQGQNTLFIGVGILEDIFHYLRYHCFLSLYTPFAAVQHKGYLIQAFPCLWWEFRDSLGRGGACKSQEMHKLSCCC